MPFEIIEKRPSRPVSIGPSGWSAHRSFTVTAGNAIEVLQLLRQQRGIRRGAIYEDEFGNSIDEYLVCISITINPITPIPLGGAGLWEVDVEYGHVTLIEQHEPRADLSPRYWLEYSEASVPIDIDRNGDPIVNAADEPYDPPTTMTVFRTTLVIEWHRYAQRLLDLHLEKQQYIGKVNASEYFGAPRRCLLCRPVAIEEISAPALNGHDILFRLTARLDYLPEITLPNGRIVPGWDTAMVNRGRRIRKIEGGYYRYQIVREKQDDPNSPPISTPVNLSEDGRSVLEWFDPPNYRIVEKYQEIDFINLVP